jgi:hypothetical protein
VCVISYAVYSAISGPAPSVGMEFFLAQGRADRVSLDDRVGFCRVPERERWIFDSLVSDFKQHTTWKSEMSKVSKN